MAEPAAASSERLPSLTGLRFVAAFGVFVCHVLVVDAARTGGWPHLVLLGPVGVSLFFVLSGFVLTLSTREAEPARDFWRRRLVKIYPSHWVVWALVMVLFWGIGMPRSPTDSAVDPTPLGDVANAFLVHTLIPLPGFVSAGNGIAWSLTCELLFYVAFPLLLPLIRKIPAERLTAAAGAAVAAVWLVPLLALGLDGPRFVLPSLPGEVNGAQLLVGYVFPPSRLPEFVLGMILARMHASGFPVRIGIVPSAGLLGAAVFLGIAVLPTPFLLAAATVVPVALLVRATAAVDVRGGRSVLRTPVMVFLGALSYAFYLLHPTVITVVLHYLGHGWGPGRVAAVSLPVALVASWLLYTRVERPCMRRFATRRPRSLPAAEVSRALPEEN